MGAIYSILNKINGKIYVGLTKTPKKRQYEHFRTLKNHNHRNRHLQRAYDKYGKDAFEFNILEHCPNDRLQDNEEWWIDYFESNNYDKGYNMTSGGEFCTLNSDVRKKISESKKGEKHPMYGKSPSRETRKKMSESHKGKYTGDKSSMYGKHHTHDTCKKISKFHNTTGYYRVSIKKSSRTKQGFSYCYRYYEEGKRKAISRVNLEDLEKEVKNRGLIWEKV